MSVPENFPTYYKKNRKKIIINVHSSLYTTIHFNDFNVKISDVISLKGKASTRTNLAF